MDRYGENFSRNLKNFRNSMGMTQHDLGELIGYSEKTVSKWEVGACIPAIDVLFKLSEIFNTSVEKLFSEHNRIYYLGIDGGGTKTDLVLENSDGERINFVHTGPCNPFDIGIEASKSVLKEAIYKVCRGISLSNVVMFAGIAGGSLGSSRQIFKQFFDEFHFKAAFNGSDNENIVSAGLGEKDGVTLILGTGVCAYKVLDGKLTRISGWGYLIDEGASAYNIGRDALSAVYSAYDGSGEKTLLSEMITEKSGMDLNLLLEEIYKKGKKYIASFSTVVFDAARRGDEVSKRIIDRNIAVAAHILETASRGFSGDKVRVVIAGRLSAREDLPELIRDKLKKPEKYDIKILNVPPANGAVRLAREKWKEISGGENV